MSESEKRNRLGFHMLLAAGACWGLSEAALGAWLKGVCSLGIFGSLMTAGAVFFLAVALRPGRGAFRLALLPAVALVLKLLDTFILGIPLSSPAILNPAYAMITEFLIFALMSLFVAPEKEASVWGRWGIGAMIGLGSALAFVFVGSLTGSPACRIAGTSIPVSLAYAPLTTAFSAVAFAAGRSIASFMSKVAPSRFLPRVLDSLSLLALFALVAVDFVLR
jgi:hypothetical protein